MRRLAPGALALLVALAALLVAPASALAQDTSGGDSTSSTGVPAPDIIPKPDSGHKPMDAGDPGGALQLLLLALIVVAVTGIVLHLVRQSRRARADTR
jgi:hypothetical protein